jgi:predicted TIM-barrel fold metal-dependent hydrolase
MADPAAATHLYTKTIQRTTTHLGHGIVEECALKSVGEDHFLFGTDSPPMVPLKMQGFNMMSQSGMTSQQYDKEMGGNAARLLKLN